MKYKPKMPRSMKSSIVVTLRVPGLHAWPGVIDTKYKDEVGYLQFPHRHEFHIRAEKQVNHSDRDIEIINLKSRLHDFIIHKWSNPSSSRNGKKQTMPNNTVDFGSMSCEMIAEELADKFKLTRCEVLEDGENGAVLEQAKAIKQEQKVEIDHSMDALQHFIQSIEYARECAQAIRDNPPKASSTQKQKIKEILEHKQVFGSFPSIEQNEPKQHRIKAANGSNVTFICGYLQSGKTTLAQSTYVSYQKSVDTKYIEVSDIVKRQIESNRRSDLQGHPELDKAIVQEIKHAAEQYEHVVVSGARQLTIVEEFKQATLIWIDTPESVRFDRYKSSKKDEGKSFDEFADANTKDLRLGLQKLKKYILTRQWLFE